MDHGTTTLHRLGGLTCRIVQPRPEPPLSLAVLCHGYGASGSDLVGLAEVLAQASPHAERARFVFPEAPLSLADLGAPAGRAWWPLDIEQLLVRRQAGEAALADLQSHVFAGVRPARRALMLCIEQALRETHLGYDRLILGGFSQGAMLACEVALRLDEPPAALGILSGTLVDKKTWQRLAKRRAGLRIVLSHGRHDPILPFANAEALADLWQEAGCRVQRVPFDGGHTIDPTALDALADAFPLPPDDARR